MGWPIPDEPISVLIADDHPMIVDGLRRLIDRESKLTFAGEASNGREATESYFRLRPDVLIIDLHMPETTGLEAIAEIRREDPLARIVILTSYDGEEEIFEGLEAGATGYLLKDSRPEVIVDCIRQAYQGRRFVSPGVAARLAHRLGHDSLSVRELQVLRLVAGGQCNKAISRTLAVSMSTTKFHINNILAKLRARSRTEALNIAIKRGIVRL